MSCFRNKRAQSNLPTKDAVGDFGFRRCQRREAGTVDMVGSSVVSVEEMQQVEPGPLGLMVMA
jgi:hypothetical protein